jgi:hypothetical protein
MPVETATYISQLDSSDPVHSDGVNQGDSHIRLIKTVLQNTLPNASGAAASWPALQALGSIGSATSAAVMPNGADPTAGLYWISTGQHGIVGQLSGNGAVPMGSVHAFLYDPGTAIMARGGTSTGTEQYIYLDGSSYPQAHFPTIANKVYGVNSGNFTVHRTTDTGRHLRSVGGVPGNTVGTYVTNGVGSHNHSASSSTSVGYAGTGCYLTDNGHNHNFSGNTNGQSSDHTHGYNYPAGTDTNIGAGAGLFYCGNLTGSGGTGGSSNDHYHGFSGTTGANNQGNAGLVFNDPSHSHSATTSTTVNNAGGSETAVEALSVLYAIKT